ncbi:hypothetical protein [Salinivibrio sp. YCSC6]|uniref:hypothetical protein n=1 Tax=Salinivibrio sp. YCSC6 TaxID=2003370 RepID=UPI000BBC6A2B|nr:hypothetical protein [Salinivibrio sp. YCSC6]PCE67544.1 hypothetical protein B6G00_04135 [Salinivibrio sp. YCSC6]QCF35548.1 hypothetical protein E8E00_04810 [Salinivibrio sp. YCSC6]
MSTVCDWINCCHDKLVKDSSFAALVGGNTLQFEPTIDDRFDIVCYGDKVNMIFDEAKRLRFFIAEYPLDERLTELLSSEEIILERGMDKSAIVSSYGEPDKSAGPRKLPGLVKNGWIQYNLKEGMKLTFSLSHSDPNTVVDVRVSVE